MHVSVDRLRIGRSQAVAFELGAAKWAILLPGAGYTAQAPLLWYARRVALQAGRNVLAITDQFERETDDPLAWVEERCEAALSHVRTTDDRPLLIAKSLTSLAAPCAARESLPAIWFTPLIAARASSMAAQVVAGLRAATAPRLLIGGSNDSTWDATVASTLSGAEILELPYADHGLEAADDVDRSLEHLARATDAVRRFIDQLD